MANVKRKGGSAKSLSQTNLMKENMDEGWWYTTDKLPAPFRGVEYVLNDGTVKHGYLRVAAVHPFDSNQQPVKRFMEPTDTVGDKIENVKKWRYM